jgi:hypothetical protein
MPLRANRLAERPFLKAINSSRACQKAGDGALPLCDILKE